MIPTVGQPISFDVAFKTFGDTDWRLQVSWDGGSTEFTEPPNVPSTDVFAATFPISALPYADGQTWSLQLALQTACGSASLASPSGPPPPIATPPHFGTPELLAQTWTISYPLGSGDGGLPSLADDTALCQQAPGDPVSSVDFGSAALWDGSSTTISVRALRLAVTGSSGPGSPQISGSNAIRVIDGAGVGSNYNGSCDLEFIAFLPTTTGPQSTTFNWPGYGSVTVTGTGSGTASPPPSPPSTTNLAAYVGHIVQWSGDTKGQKTAWLVGPDLKRRWIPTTAIYQCLKAHGIPGPEVLPSNVLNQLPDLTGISAPCRLSGWAPGGNPSSPSSQVSADAAYIHEDGECAPNSALLFRVRGSSESPGTDRLGQWAAAAGTTLIDDGWRVRDMQAEYPAPGLPLWQIGAAVVTGNPTAVAGALASLIRYRNVSTDSWPHVRDELVAAYNRCPQRTILLSGYSEGGIVLRYVVPHLPEGVLSRIARIDLVADPTEQGSIDSRMQHSGAFSSRWTPEGIDTFAARKTNFFFKQTHYPGTVVGKTWQYCLPYDIVCDANLVNFGYLGGESRRHTSYNFADIGHAAGAYVNAHRSWR